jgi:hypothetical protein
MMNMFFRTCCVILPICFFSRAPVAGQSYLPLAVENATWIINFSDNDFTEQNYYAYKVQGDTMFEGTSYKKVYYWELTDDMSDPYQAESNHLIALMRDDSLNGKTYAVVFPYIQDLELCTTAPLSEVLLYDFALEPGDTVTDCRTMNAAYEMTIVSVLSDTLFNAIRRVWSIWEDLSLIEGIGYSRGLFTEASGFISAAYGTYLVDYCIGTNFECGLHTATNEIVADQTIVFPNPVTDELYWQTHVVFESAVIYTPTGQFVELHACAGSPSVDVSRLPSGLYFLELREARGSMMTRFLKQ